MQLWNERGEIQFLLQTAGTIRKNRVYKNTQYGFIFSNRLVASYQKLYRSIFKQQATIQAFANLEGIVGAISVCILLWIGGKRYLLEICK